MKFRTWNTPLVLGCGTSPRCAAFPADRLDDAERLAGEVPRSRDTWLADMSITAELAAAAGLPDRAAHHFERAIAINDDIGAIPWSRRTRSAMQRRTTSST